MLRGFQPQAEAPPERRKSRGCDFRVYGILIGYKANTEAERRPILEAARDSFMPIPP